MIIGISGKIGSGKDTVGEIIQYLSSKETGTFTAWKNAVKAHGPDSTVQWEVHKFADALKDITCRLIGCTREQLEDREFKNKPLGEEWHRYHIQRAEGRRLLFMYATFDEANEHAKKFEDSEVVKIELTPRKILQLLGTEAGREMIHPNIWVNATFAKYKSTTTSRFGVMDAKSGDIIHESESIEIEDHILGKYPNWIITDMRFTNEKKAIEERGGVSIRIERPTEKRFPNLWKRFQEQNEHDEWDEFLKAEGEFEKVYHASETGLDDEKIWDYYIKNETDNLDDLIKEVQAILNDEYFQKKMLG